MERQLVQLKDFNIMLLLKYQPVVQSIVMHMLETS